MRFLRMAMAAAALTVALGIPSTASAQINTFQIGSTAQLGPEGASLNVPVTINCAAGFEGGFTIFIRQAQGKRVIDGVFSSSGVTCNGLTETLNVVVQSGAIRFKQGSAAASGSMFVFQPFTNLSDTAVIDPQAIRIVK